MINSTTRTVSSYSNPINYSTVAQFQMADANMINEHVAAQNILLYIGCKVKHDLATHVIVQAGINFYLAFM